MAKKQQRQKTTEGFVIRRAIFEDLPRVSYVTNMAYRTPFIKNGVITKAHQKDMKNEFSSKKIEIMVAEVAGKIIGAVKFKKVNDTLYFYQLALLKTYRKKGVASKLIESIETLAIKRKLRKVSLDCMQEKGLPAYYERLGYKIDKIEKHKTNHIAYMSRNL
jgi:ribosomal protein S18 acetylase RimI-like enzyme